MLRDILSGEDAQIIATQSVIAEANPDILLLIGFDYDLDGVALSAFADQLNDLGAPYPHRFSRRPNTGIGTGLDMDGDGRLGGARDAQGFGYFSGYGGMAVLSRHPILAQDMRDYTEILWRDLPGANTVDLSQDATAIQRLSSINHWALPISIDGIGDVELLTIGATPPVFDGPEDRNGHRNRDELRLWHLYLNGDLSEKPTAPVILLGKMNVDPFDGDGQSETIRAVLKDPRLQDPRPASPGGRAAADNTHKGPPELDTAAFRPAPDGPGNLRADYILPDARLEVADAGVVWPRSGDPGAPDIERAARHRLVWVDLMRNR
ncbi:endonuclease/exonuclease/phosphatase family protein [Actibacterium sp. 188UL27-1]|uniref:endonuclease/exonuclease/phosphatase family protein n=1 Tax=Actibacterium sp. 188UL27-1 TaxID=2786961 RepID=UPI001EF4B2B9|nr:endonuclease/exonuclease/phosphatase family protein [Actibacterium sp. 188UL27-1]